MNQPLEEALGVVRAALLDDAGLVRAVASGRRRGAAPRWRRAEFRYVDLKAGRRLQATTFDDTQAHTANHEPGAAASAAVEALLAEPFGNWHWETTSEAGDLRVTKKGEALVSRRAQAVAVTPDRAHDRDKERLLDPADPLFAVLGLADADGRIKPSRQAKYRQVEEFLRHLDAALADARSSGRLRRATPGDPLRVVDLGCGNAYLTLAAVRFLTEERGLPVRMIGVDVKEQSRRHNAEVAAQVGLAAEFVVGGIGDVTLAEAPDVVLALHACDTATDDALARAVGWEAALVLAAPCCHHDLAAQLKRGIPPQPYAMLTRHGILRERFADTLTDAVRASLMRAHGYRVEVVEFVASEHTPRNTLLRAVRTGAADASAREEFDRLVDQWQVRPRLAELLADLLGEGRAS